MSEWQTLLQTAIGGIEFCHFIALFTNAAGKRAAVCVSCCFCHAEFLIFSSLWSSQQTHFLRNVRLHPESGAWDACCYFLCSILSLLTEWACLVRSLCFFPCDIPHPALIKDLGLHCHRWIQYFVCKTIWWLYGAGHTDRRTVTAHAALCCDYKSLLLALQSFSHRWRMCKQTKFPCSFLLYSNHF